jgi:hypothetical protein
LEIENFQYGGQTKNWKKESATVLLTSVYNPLIEAEFIKTSGGSTNLFLGATTSSSSELVVATIKNAWRHWKLALNLPSIRCPVNKRLVGNFT